MSSNLEQTGLTQCYKAALRTKAAAISRGGIQSQFAILFCQNQRKTVGTGLASFPDAFDQAGYIKKKKKKILA